MYSSDKVTVNPKLENQLHYDGDNAWYVLHSIIPFLKLSEADKRIMRYAYGDGETKSYEMDSDGETFVFDLFLDGVIKSPSGVTHDYVNRVPGHITPDGKKWTFWQTNALYYRVSRALGYPISLRFRRWVGVTLWPFWWK